jgi:hypothetical protein
MSAQSPAPEPALRKVPTTSPADVAPKASSVFWSKVLHRPDPLTSIAFTVPIFLAYHLGILLVDRRSQVDFVSTLMLRLLDASVPAYVLTTLAMTLVLLLTVWWQQKRGSVPVSSFGRVLAEALGFALLVLIALGWATHQMVHYGEPGSAQLHPIDKLVLSAGAGFHEEFLFRAVFISGGSLVIGRTLRLSPRAAVLLCMVLSSLAFALVQHFVIEDDPLLLNVFGYRVLEGMLFAILYVARGFAVAVYTHTFYEALAFFVYS